MLSTKELMHKGVGALIDVFGKQYLRDNYNGTCVAHGFVGGNKFRLFVGIKGSDELPDREADDKGWVVYGDVLLDATNGNVLKIDYVLE